MKKIRVRVLAIFVILIASVMVVKAASVSKFCTISIGEISAESGAVGLARQASFVVETYSASNAPINAAVHACWNGWPYTLEQSQVVQIGETWSGTEEKSR